MKRHWEQGWTDGRRRCRITKLNFLGHIVLARDSAESRIGNLLGDFVKGLPSAFPDEYGAELVDGILMHRAVDVFTDRHPAFLRARGLLAPERRRFAGIVVDIFFDHFLSIRWERWMDGKKEDFVSRFYGELVAFRLPRITADFPEITARMVEQDWLGTYASLEGMDLTLRRVSARSPRLAPMIGSMDDLAENFAQFEECFEEFFPDVRTFAKDWQASRTMFRDDLADPISPARLANATNSGNR